MLIALCYAHFKLTGIKVVVLKSRKLDVLCRKGLEMNK